MQFLVWKGAFSKLKPISEISLNLSTRLRTHYIGLRKNHKNYSLFKTCILEEDKTVFTRRLHPRKLGFILLQSDIASNRLKKETTYTIL